jgi:hypothetical protein
VQQTTTFSNDANVVKATQARHTAVPRALYDSSTSNFDQSGIADFLGKPHSYATGSFSSTDVAAVPILQLNSPQDIISSNPLFANKLTGFLGWRFTANFKLQVNASRFQQGRYLMNFTHTGGNPAFTLAASNEKSAYWYVAHNYTLVQRTTLPHVEIDLNCDTECEINIPYSSVFNYNSLTPTIDQYTSIGTLTIWPYVPLSAATGPSSCGWTLWVYFTDVELIGPAAPQVGTGGIKSSRKSKSYSEKEADSVAVGPISSLLVKVSDASNFLVGVPFISDYAKTVSWVSDRLANVASVFGWSKPLNLAPTHRMIRDVLPYFGNIDNVTSGKPISATVKNDVGVFPGFSGTDVDELDFTHLCTIPAYDTLLSWAPSDPAGTTLYSNKLHIQSSIFSATVGPNAVKCYKPFEFVSTFFSQWRGSLVYKFKFVKTEFHSGRLVVAFFFLVKLMRTPLHHL